MLSNSTKSVYSYFSTNKSFEQAKTKAERIDLVTSKLNFSNLLTKLSRKVSGYSKNSRKDETLAKQRFESVKRKFKVFINSKSSDQLLVEIISDCRKVIVYSNYGGETFVKGYQLLAKCFLKRREFDGALYCVELVNKQADAISDQNILIKSIALFSQNFFIQLKEYLKGIDKKALKISSETRKEFEQLGYDHLNIEYLLNFVDDPNFAAGSSKAVSENLYDWHSMSNPIEMKTNYQIDNRCEIVNDDYKGRHFVSKGFIPRGTQVLVERSYSVVLEVKCRLEMCLYCARNCELTFVPCRHCTGAVFCNDRCFTNAWSVFHCFECTLLDAFQDNLYASLHMYRSISRIGVSKALQVKAELEEQVKNENIAKKAEASKKSEKTVLFDRIISKYLQNENMRQKVEHEQTEEEKTELYRMMSTLLDHDEKFESYYDVCYMGVSIDVALLLLVNRYLIGKQKQAKLDVNLPVWTLLNSDQFEKLSQDDLISIFSKSDYMDLVGIVLVNIRKLSTNVFSWNLYTENSSVKKTIGSCQCLVGSLINHSCEPNIEWDFKNACIVYTTTRDILAGEEINNSYGPYKGGNFVDRQMLLANNYYFNCYCTACREDMITYSKLLSCKKCNGPVVYLDDSYINSSCMNCYNILAGSKEIVTQMIHKRNQFQRLCENYGSLKMSHSHDLDIENYLAQLHELLEFELNNVYKENAYLQLNIDRLCKLLYHLNQKNAAFQYMKYKVINAKPYNFLLDNKEDEEQEAEGRDKSYCLQIEHLKSLIFWFNLFGDYIKNHQQDGDSSSNSDEYSENITFAQRSFVETHAYIQRLVLSLSFKFTAKLNSFKILAENSIMMGVNTSSSMDEMLSNISKSCQQNLERLLPISWPAEQSF